MDEPAADGIRLHRDDARGHYTLDLHGEAVAMATFHDLGNGTTVVPHTEVLSSRRGQGIGALLVGAVLDDLRSRHQQVVPRCWYVAQFIDEHPDYLDLVAR